MKDREFNYREILAEPVASIEALGEKSRIAIIPREYVFPWLIIVFFCGVIFKICQLFFQPGYFWLLACIVWFCCAWTLIAGKKSHEFTDEFYPLPLDEWIDLPRVFIPATSNMFLKSNSQKFEPVVEEDINGKLTKYIPFQNHSELHSSMRVSIGGKPFTNYLRCNKIDDSWSASIPFDLAGLHPHMNEIEIIDQSQAISNALKDIPEGESICFVLGCRSKSERRKQQLSDLIDEKFPIMGIMLASEKLKVEEITEKGLRQEWHQYVMTSWSQKNQDLRQSRDSVSKFINLFSNYFGRYSRKLLGTEKSYLNSLYVKLGKDIYSNSFIPWKTRLESRGKLTLSSFDTSSAFDLLSSRFNNQDYGENSHDDTQAAQVISVSDISGKLKHRVIVKNPHSPKDLLSKVIEGENGRSSCPNHDQRRDRIRIRDDLIAVLIMVSPPPKVFYGEQLFWVWNRVKQQNVRDIDIFLEISAGDKAESQKNLTRLVRQSSHANRYAAKTGSVMDVDATYMSAEALEAQNRLREDAQPLVVSFTIHVYRKTDVELDIACETLIDLFDPAKLIREEKVCWRRWLESLPINNDKIQTSTELFSEARMTTLDTMSIRSLLTLVRPQSIHQTGVEFICKEGGQPIYIDLVERCMRAIITGTTRSGKLYWLLVL